MAQQDNTSGGRLGWIISTRPAELSTIAAGGVGLLLAAAFNAGEDAKTALIAIVAVVPALVSYLHDLGKAGGEPRVRSSQTELRDELAYTVARASRRARVCDARWQDDMASAEKLIPLAERIVKIGPEPGPPKKDTDPGGNGEPQGPGGGTPGAVT